mgnify:FL=1
MAGIPITDANKAIMYKSVPWAKGGKGVISIKRESFPKGRTPDHLQRYTDQLASAARQCASETANLSGADRVKAMNGCVSERLGGGVPART